MEDTDLDPYSLLMGDEPTAQQQAQAYAAALRRQNSLAGVEQLSGNPTLAAAGRGTLGQVQHGQQQLGQMLENRLQRNVQAQHYKDLENYYNQRGANQADNLDLQRQRLESPLKTVGGGLYQVKDGQAKQLVAPQLRLVKGGALGGPVSQKDLTKDERDFEARMSASGARAGNLGVDYARLANAQNLKTIIQNGGGVIPPQMVAEATAALGRLVSGGALTEGTMEKMIPHTAGMDLANKLQYITGNPQDAGVKGFLEYMGHTADREAANASQRMKTERVGRASAFSRLYKSSPESMYRIGHQYGLEKEDVDNIFSSKPTAQPGIATPGATPGGGVPAHTHWLKSPDGKMRIQAGDDGKPLPNAKPEPVPAKEIASRG